MKHHQRTKASRIFLVTTLIALALSGAAQAVDIPLKVNVVLPSGCAPIHSIAKIQSDVDDANSFFQDLGWQFFIAEMNWLCDDDLSTLPNTGSSAQNKVLRDDLAAIAGNVTNAVNVYYLTTVHIPFAAVADRGQSRLFLPFSVSGTNNPHGLPHELGHIFGLSHTHSVPNDANGNPLPEFVNGDECEIRGDKICDTPADPGWQSSMVDVNGSTCSPGPSASPLVDSNGDTYTPPFSNIMSYYNNACITGFSPGQIDVMNDWYASHGPYDMELGLWVCPWLNCQYKTLQEAVDAVAPGGTATIVLSHGTFSTNTFLARGRNLTIIGAGRINTILDGQNSHRVLRVTDGSTARLENLRILGGLAPNGGGIGIFGDSTVTLDNVGVRANHATELGGGVYISDGSALNLIGSTLTGNTADLVSIHGDCFKTLNGTVEVDDRTVISAGNCE